MDGLLSEAPKAVRSWTDDELRRIGSVEELQLAPCRHDGSLRPFTTMWVVRVGDDLYVRSAGGPNRPWYRHALATGSGRIRAGGVDADVQFSTAEPGADELIDVSYHTKYDYYGAAIVATLLGLRHMP